MMSVMRTSLLIAFLAMTGCSGMPERKLERGIYEVVSVVADQSALPTAGPGERWFPYVPAARDDGPPRRVLLREKWAVPLELARDPVLTVNEEGRKQIALTLTPKAGSAFGDLTRRCVGGRVAVVIAGDVISYHTIRQPILGNSVIISC